MADERNFENARDLYRKARAAKSYGFSSIGGSNGTITETIGHREEGIPNTFTHVNHPETGWQTFVGTGTPEIKAAQHAAIAASYTKGKRSDRPATPEPGYEQPKPPKATMNKVGK
jgi:hypothetical protein